MIHGYRHVSTLTLIKCDVGMVAGNMIIHNPIPTFYPCLVPLFFVTVSSLHLLIFKTLGAHAPEGWSVCVCVCVCVPVCLVPRVLRHYAQLSVQPKVPTASAQSGKHFKCGIFSKNALFKSYGVKKPTSICLPRHHMAPMERHFARNF